MFVPCPPLVVTPQSGLQNARKRHISVAAVAHGSDSHIRCREGGPLDSLILMGDVKVREQYAELRAAVDEREA